MSMRVRAGFCPLLFILFFTPALAGSQPVDHAPIGVMGDHLHNQGEWMVGYHYRHIASSGFKNGEDNVESSAVMALYGEAATKMQMDMHMLEIMYGVSDDLTLMIMPQYMFMDMTHQSSHGGGHSHTHQVEGPGDTEVTGLYSFYRSPTQWAHLNLGMSLPTGSIDEAFIDHHANVYPMPYNMQLGSGTFDPIIGATYAGSAENWAWGAQTLNYLRLGKNANGYRQGNKFTASAWAARNLARFVSASLRLEGEAWGDVEGRDVRLPLTAIAGANPDELAGERLLAHVGLNLLADGSLGSLAGHRLAAELGIPLYERFSGPQSATDWRLTLAWQKAF